MKAEELMFGNLVLNDGCLSKITGILSHQSTILTKQGNEITARIELLQPISLTEEWLLRAGFKKSILHTWYKEDLSLAVNDDGSYYMTDKASVVIKYVHQLQNLYFALAGEELIFKTE